jgi:hypothetical protein
MSKAHQQTIDILAQEIVKATERGDRETADQLSQVLVSIVNEGTN